MEDSILYRVTCAEELWSVRGRRGVEVGVFGTRKEAVTWARKLAQSAFRDGRVVVHSRDGGVRTEVRVRCAAASRPPETRKPGALGDPPS